MEEARVRFGDITSADVKFWLMGPNNEKYERNPVFLHSVILRRSEYFRVVMSERWSSGTSEKWLNISHKFDDFLKCIEVMYGGRVYFSNVEECLAILLVASELLCDDCSNKCMQYLEAVRWSAEQESQIRDVLSSLGLKLLPDLEARLGKEVGDIITYVEMIIREMFAIIEGSSDNATNLGTAEKYIAGILEGNACRDVVEVCERVFSKEFESSICSHSFEVIASLFKLTELCDGEVMEVCRRMLLQGFKSSIRSRYIDHSRAFFKHIEHCDGEILKAAFIAFCEDPEFSKYVEKCDKQTHYDYVRRKLEDVFYIIIWFMKAIGDGKIIISRASRISFLKTWLPIMGNIIKRLMLRKLGEFDRATLNVIECLPPVDRKSMCVVWLEAYRAYCIDITMPMSLFNDLHDAHYKSTSK